MGGVDSREQGRNPTLARLFGAFLRLGLTAFGGPAMVAYIRKMAVEQKRWLDGDSFRNGVALCQTIPGATAMQVAAYVGLRARGLAGAAASFIGFGIPAFLLMLLLSALYSQAYSLPVVVSAFGGLQALIVAIVANSTITFGRTSLKNWRDIAIAAIAAALFWLGLSPVFVIVAATVLGLVLHTSRGGTAQPAGAVSKSRPSRSFFLLLAVAAVGYVLLFFLQRRFFDLASLMSLIDLSAFGGGFASLPLMFNQVVEVHAWMNGPTFLNGIALGQITPGPIVITATFVGYLLYGLAGAVIATVAIFLPSFLMVTGVTPYFDRLQASPYFNRAITGVLASFVGLLLTVTIRFELNVTWDIPRVILAVAAFAALYLKVEILWVVLGGVVVSILMFLFGLF
jgi:chromate transporter